MRRLVAFILSITINATTVPVVAAEYAASRDTDSSRVPRATVHSQQPNAVDKENACRAYANSFYESAMLRHASAGRVDGPRVLAALDSVIDAFNDLLATKCGS